jgi:hypothetical protein
MKQQLWWRNVCARTYPRKASFTPATSQVLFTIAANTWHDSPNFNNYKESKYNSVLYLQYSSSLACMIKPHLILHTGGADMPYLQWRWIGEESQECETEGPIKSLSIS